MCYIKCNKKVNNFVTFKSSNIKGGVTLDWLNAVKDVGFNIVCLMAMAYYIYITDEKNRKERIEESQRHQEETKSLQEAINNNTIVMNKLLDRMESDK